PSAPNSAAEAPLSPFQQKLAEKRSELSSLLAKYRPEHPDVLRVTREVRDLAAQVAKEPAPKATAVAQVSGEPKVAAPEATPKTAVLPEVDLSIDFYEAEVRHELDQLNREIARKEAKKTEISKKLT